MEVVMALVGATALAAVPVAWGWRRGASETAMARAFGLDYRQRRLDPEAWARQTGTGLIFRQIAYSAFVWMAGGLLLGFLIGGLVQALLLAVAAGLFYLSSLANVRQEYRLRQAQEIARSAQVLETLLAQGRGLPEGLRLASEATGPVGAPVLRDLVERLDRSAPERYAEAVREWSRSWDNPAAEMLAAALIAALESRIEIGHLLYRLRRTLLEVIEVLTRARAEARGIEWQARFLALEPPLVLALIRLIAPEMGQVWTNPLFLLPVAAGSALSYVLSMRLIRQGLSMEASVGLMPGGRGEIPTDRFGQPL
jgi:hypothetical protein